MAKHAGEQWRRPRYGLIALVVIVVLACLGGGVYAGFVLMSTAAEAEPHTDPSSSATSHAVPPPLPTPSPTPTDPAYLPCETKTTMSVMAHYDDDLLFANPALLQAVQADDCVRTVFLTASDAGQGTEYYRNREIGILRAYDVMRGADGLWNEKKITLDTGVDLNVFTPGDGDNISVAFMRLPDGGLTRGVDGALTSTGFSSTGDSTLPWLLDGTRTSIQKVDTGVSVTLEQIRASVAEIMRAYSPTDVYTHVPGQSRWSADDHPDHSAVGTIVREAAAIGGVTPAQMHYAVGYSTGTMDQNVAGELLEKKVAAFSAYAQMDSVSSCDSLETCLALKTFGQSLTRQYLLTDEDVKQ